MSRRRPSYRRRRTTRTGRSLRGRNSKLVIPQKGIVKVKFVKTVAMSRALVDSYNPTEQMEVNNLAWMESNGYVNRNLNLLTGLFETYKVNGAKIVHKCQRDPAAAEQLDGMYQAGLFRVGTTDSVALNMVVTGGHAPYCTQVAEMPGGVFSLIPSKDTTSVFRRKYYVNFKRLVANNKFLNEQNEFSGSIFSLGVGANYGAPAERIVYEYGWMSSDSAFGGGGNVLQIQTEVTLYIQLWKNKGLVQ